MPSASAALPVPKRIPMVDGVQGEPVPNEPALPSAVAFRPGEQEALRRDVRAFIADLLAKGLAGYEFQPV